MFVNFNILNQLGSPAINSNTFANRPAAGQTGRLFVSTDTFEVYRDNGTTWDLIGGPGSSTITGTGTATQVAYFTSSQAIGSSANLYWDNTNTRLGIGTSTPGVRLDIHGTGIMQHINATSATANSLMAFQRTGTNVWRLGDQYNGGSNYFELHNTTLASNAIQIAAATNKSILTSIETYSTGVARGNYLDYTLSLANGTTFTSPNTVTAFGATLNLNIAGSATIPAGARSGADFFNGINFTSAGTFTVNQASTIRAFSNVTAGWAFNGSAVGTVTHLAGLRVLFPTNSGSAINVTDNYAILINNQNANTGTINYTNRWGIYQEGSSDLNYMAANLLLGSTVNTGDKLQVTGTTYLSSQLTVGNTLYVDTVFNRVGIGTLSPSDKLEVNGAIFTTSNTVLTTTKGAIFDFNDGQDAGRFLAYKATGSNLLFYTNPNGGSLTLAATINSSGNLGLGVTPSAWGTGSSARALQLNAGSLFSFSTTQLHLEQNSYFNSGFFYVNNGLASAYRQVSGQHIWLNAPAGTAGNAITFTQAMTLDASGNLGINQTPNASYGKLQIKTPASAYTLDLIGRTAGVNAESSIYFWNSAQTSMLAAIGNVGSNLEFYTNGAGPYMRIATSGNVLIGTTTDAGQKLQVNGQGLFRGSFGTVISIYDNNTSAVTGQLTTDAYVTANNQLNTALTAANGLSIKFFPNGSGTSALTLTTGLNAEFNGSIKTGAPTTGTAAAWKLGSRVAATVVVNTTEYIEVDIGGTLYKLATVT